LHLTKTRASRNNLYRLTERGGGVSSLHRLIEYPTPFTRLEKRPARTGWHAVIGAVPLEKNTFDQWGKNLYQSGPNRVINGPVLLYQSGDILELAPGSDRLRNPVNIEVSKLIGSKMWDVPHLKCRI
jgi:hypothetical protein